jgi:hypothetical protein
VVGTVRLNGLDITTRGKFTIDPEEFVVSSDKPVAITVPVLDKETKRVRYELPLHPGELSNKACRRAKWCWKFKSNIVLDSGKEGTVIKGLPVAGQLRFEFTPGITRIPLTLSVPISLNSRWDSTANEWTPHTSTFGVEGVLKTSNLNGLSGSLKFIAEFDDDPDGPKTGPRIGPLTPKLISLEYDFENDVFAIEGIFELKLKGGLSPEVILKGFWMRLAAEPRCADPCFGLSGFAGGVDGVNVPLGNTGIFLQRLNVEVNIDNNHVQFPVTVTVGGGVSLGPQVEDTEVISFDGSGPLALRAPWEQAFRTHRC